MFVNTYICSTTCRCRHHSCRIMAIIRISNSCFLSDIQQGILPCVHGKCKRPALVHAPDKEGGKDDFSHSGNSRQRLSRGSGASCIEPVAHLSGERVRASTVRDGLSEHRKLSASQLVKGTGGMDGTCLARSRTCRGMTLAPSQHTQSPTNHAASKVLTSAHEMRGLFASWASPKPSPQPLERAGGGAPWSGSGLTESCMTRSRAGFHVKAQIPSPASIILGTRPLSKASLLYSTPYTNPPSSICSALHRSPPCHSDSPPPTLRRTTRPTICGSSSTRMCTI